MHFISAIIKFEIILNNHQNYASLLHERKKVIKHALHFAVVIKKVEHNSTYVYNEYVADGMTWLTKDVTTKEQKRKNDVKAKAFFPRRSSMRKKIARTEALKCTTLTGTSASRSFSLIAARMLERTKKWLPLHSHYIPTSISHGDFFFTKKIVKKLFTAFIEFARRW